MRTVREWASRRGYRYVHVPDADFLAVVPAWFRDKAGGVIQPVTDLGHVPALDRAVDQEAVPADVVHDLAHLRGDRVRRADQRGLGRVPLGDLAQRERGRHPPRNR